MPYGAKLLPKSLRDCLRQSLRDLEKYVALFADDVKMVAKSRTKKMNQDDLDSLVLWQNKWLLKFNTKDNKCKIIHVGKNNPCNHYFMSDILLPAVDSEKKT